MVNTNILSQRYASTAMNVIWSEEGRVLAERELWIAVMKAQRELGMDIPSDAIEKYEHAKNNIDLARIEEIELKTRHDVKARIEAFNEVSGVSGYIHRGMTSRDATDNVEQMQVLRAAELLAGKFTTVLSRLLDKSEEYRNIPLVARTHHQPAQPTTVGRRFAMWAEESALGLQRLDYFVESYPLRGIKGAVGTQTDMLTLLGDSGKVRILERRVADQLGFPIILTAPGQVYPRSLDMQYVNSVTEAASAMGSFTTTMRLMAGYELVTEGFKEGQVGSSAMPHKMNTRSSERVDSLQLLLKMYQVGASMNSGTQWEEGDVSCSAARRVILPDASYAADGMLETTLTILNEMGVYEKMTEKELGRYMPFVASTAFLMEAINNGADREAAHKVIKRHTTQAALAMRQGEDYNLTSQLAQEEIYSQKSISRERLQAIIDQQAENIGLAQLQIDTVKKIGEELIDKRPNWREYQPEQIR